MSFTISLPQVEGALERAKNEARDAERRAAALEKIAEGLRELNGSVENVLDAQPAAQIFLPLDRVDHPRGREAIRQIVADRPGFWTIRELHAESERRGWPTTRKAVEVAVHRLRRAGEARWVRTGVYEFASDGKEGAIESEPSGAAMIASA